MQALIQDLKLTATTGVTVQGEVAASQDYPTFKPTIDFNFAGKIRSKYIYKNRACIIFK